jgi:hypothetical protein
MLADTTTPVSARITDILLNAPAQPQCGGIPFALDTAESKLAYERHLDLFLSHLAEACDMFRKLPAECSRMELSVFFLALFSMQSFLSRLQPAVKIVALEAIGKDLDDERVVREVVAVRRQMESVEKCFLEEKDCKCSRVRSY